MHFAAQTYLDLESSTDYLRQIRTCLAASTDSGIVDLVWTQSSQSSSVWSIDCNAWSCESGQYKKDQSYPVHVVRQKNGVIESVLFAPSIVSLAPVEIARIHLDMIISRIASSTIGDS